MLAAPNASAFDRLACLKRGRGICFLTYFCTNPMTRRDGIGNRLAAWVKITCGTGACTIAAASLSANMSIAARLLARGELPLGRADLSARQSFARIPAQVRTAC